MQARKEIILFNKASECCGCEACVQICPISVISMVMDDEGYFYPKINRDECISCRKCLDVCPIKYSFRR